MDAITTDMDFDDHCTEIAHQADLLSTGLEEGTRLTASVPSCPDWNLAQLLRHLGEAHRWVEELVRTRATEPPPDTALRHLPRDTTETPAALAAWLTEGARLLAGTLRAAGPDARIWTPLPSGSPRFFARRMAHETVMHRADAALTLGTDFTVDQRVALDCLDEWMELGSLPEMFDYHPDRRELLGGVSPISVDQPAASGAVHRKAEHCPRTGCPWVMRQRGEVRCQASQAHGGRGDTP
ncbi:maleylpyruvate isomerase N-terminal domain-containing protein [Streptomyces sp. Isolate_219]|uniref:maleylpyruvate isomerase N-terminal domain-containing protein n=1 Tax=Streptomyces sp. Isolate_219 TaxID=2950110 RepID=UPI0021C971DD|nr:maleylpyruvate isomerase N-terminal domain-containing protein [Streptomyces sp. Isolate_219]MCR8575424.1 maleylpyruvate isomerase N-terminal domain-containing protein [Streptomyces sp. Isolate_219]